MPHHKGKISLPFQRVKDNPNTKIFFGVLHICPNKVNYTFCPGTTFGLKLRKLT